MAEKDPKSNDGLSAEELEQQDVADLPRREAMSLISPDPMPPTTDFNGDVLLDRGLDPSFEKGPPLIKPTA
jgi:hypothetical protein